MPNTFVHFHVIEGFRQEEEGWWNGCHELVELLNQEFDQYSRCTLQIRLSKYDADFESIAQNLAEKRKRYKVPRDRFVIALFPFSWGVGHGVPVFGKALQRYGFNVHVCVPSDGVYWRDDILLGFLGNWTAVLGDARIKFPINILNTIPFCQKQNIPRGRGIATTQHMEPMVELPYIHTQMDDAPEWHLKCIEEAKKLVSIYLPSKQAPSIAPTVEKVMEQLSESKLDQKGEA